MDKNRRIAYLISKKRMGVLEDAEQQELEDWVQVSSDNGDLFRRLMKKDFSGDFALYRNIDTDKAWGRYTKRKKGFSRYILAWSSAAVVAVFLSAGLYLWNEDSHNGQEKYQLAAIASGSSRAVLTLSDGSHRTLDSVDRMLYIDESRIVRNSHSALSYNLPDGHLDDDADVRLKYNVLSIPDGSEYQLVLSDGTKVWLNARSDIRFPVQFGHDERVIYLKGEAYFEVARDTVRPFYVQLGNEVSIKVLGTSFNVRSYEDGRVEAVLEKGSVEIRKDDVCRRMVPGTLAVYSSDEDDISLETVNTELYTSWRIGQYIFQNERLDTILYRLSEWYSMEVVFRDEEAKEMVYSGSIRKYDSITNLLEALEATGGVSFAIDGSALYVELSK